MPRTKGAKDKEPREMKPGSLANIPQSIPGFLSAKVRVYGPANDVRWFVGINTQERGQAISVARKATTP